MSAQEFRPEAYLPSHRPSHLSLGRESDHRQQRQAPTSQVKVEGIPSHRLPHPRAGIPNTQCCQFQLLHDNEQVCVF